MNMRDIEELVKELDPQDMVGYTRNSLMILNRQSLTK